MANEANLSGAQRAAIFLLGVGEEAATEVMRHLSGSRKLKWVYGSMQK